MRLTIKKYANAKFEYLAYCLKIKEMDDEEYTFNVSIILTVKFPRPPLKEILNSII